MGYHKFIETISIKINDRRTCFIILPILHLKFRSKSVLSSGKEINVSISIPRSPIDISIRIIQPFPRSVPNLTSKNSYQISQSVTIKITGSKLLISKRHSIPGHIHYRKDRRHIELGRNNRLLERG